ncbi:diguanylate cyclase (GGDEF)-like protein [Actinoplanes campanulatus]|uniref:Diguanylate cyclase (GGDEF)-like protein n=1 Tax=Actinoplanes campanulatus TaxID=113559 RepID=A0A7W5AGB3_9ACTN|nr:bifunctional diguanylate cyclase/phosphodiesterase [Actinoplanes campanulatus]MBB3095540.1 diguanylate cyclase (GGDEF)-like protein [Actinoplanes campanulatus]
MGPGNRWWRWWTAGGVLATVGYYLLPADSPLSHIGYSVVGLLAGLAILVGVRRNRPPRPAAWILFAAGISLSALGDLVWWYLEYVRHEEPYPSVADVLYLGAYPPLIAGLFLLLRGRCGRDTGGLIDASIAALGLSLVLWVFVLHPVAAGESASLLESGVSTAYPALDMLLLVMVARLLLGARARSVSSDLLGVAAGLLLVADIAFSVLSLHFDYDGRGLDWTWLLAYVVWAAAALHPSMAAAETGDRPEMARAGRGRLAVSACCAVLPPTLLFIPSVGADQVDRVVIAAGAIVLFALGVARMAGVMRQVHRQSAELRRLADHDDLTGLHTRRHFQQALRDALATGRPQVILVGLNDLGSVNDELGPVAGDHVIVRIAERVRMLAGPQALVARLSGDEFAVLLHDAPHAEADAVAGRMIGAVHYPVRSDDFEVLVGAAIGVTDSGGADDPVEVLRRAGVAMCVARRTGETYARWTPAVDERSSEQARLGAQIRHGLDTGQFQVVYQPIVRLPECRVVAVEALVRWRHPQRGLISPALFIPVAERNGLIVELGAWILETACERLARWTAELGPLAPDRVSVNVSARQLARSGFAASVAAVLARTGLAPHRLTVEVTETAVFEGGPAVAALHELRALGVRIALDDFGTGHSSLGLLQSVPVDVLKIDKSFVDRVTEAGRHAVIAEAMMQVTSGLGLDAVAEGVETAEQAEVLYRLGYRLLQGYHFGRPAEEPDFTVRVVHA